MNRAAGLETAGVAHAAILAAMLGILALALVNVGCEMSEAFKTSIHNIGKLWMPGAQGIGPYSGKETVSLVVWLISWFGLHKMLRGREGNMAAALIVFLMGVGLATTLLWPPVFYLFGQH